MLRLLPVLLLSFVPLAARAQTGEHDPPPPPPPLQTAQPYVPPSDQPSSDADDSPELQRYQACFQKMIDAGAADNSFMRKCLGIAGNKSPKASGPHAPLSRDEIVAALTRGNPALKKCYDKLLMSWPSSKKPAGSLALALTVSSGVVMKAEYDAGLGDAGLITCFTEQLKSISLRKSATPVDLTVRWSLVPTGKGGRQGAVSLQDKALKMSGPGYGLSSDDILTVFRKNAPRVRRCYDELLLRKPDASGAAAVSLTVSPKGRVAKVAFRQLAFGDEPFAACLTKELKSWRFPRPQSGAEVSVDYPPFEFHPAGARATP